jgi:hypothetical protein
MKSFKDLMVEAKATYCGRCGTTHVPPSQGGTCPALKNEEAEMNEAETPNLPGKATHLTNKDVRHPEHGIISGSTTLRHIGGDNYEVRAGRAKGKTISLDKQHVQKMNEETQQGDTMSMMEQYLAAIEGKTDFRAGLAEQTHPKTDKEKDLAKLAPPHDKITHADVMAGRGVKEEGVMDTVKKIGKKVIDTVAPGDEALLKDLQKKVGVPQTGKKPTAEEMSSKEKMKRGMYNKEETEVSEAMISYGDFMGKIKAHKAAGNKVVDDKYTDKKAEYTSIDGDGVGRKVTHTHSGQKMENLGQVEKRDEKETTTTEKRGRGRPAGSKSGARN